jgi:hypothetical protein
MVGAVRSRPCGKDTSVSVDKTGMCTDGNEPKCTFNEIKCPDGSGPSHNPHDPNWTPDSGSSSGGNSGSSNG